MRIFLEFEKPVAELEAKIDELRVMAGADSINLADDVAVLTDKADKQLRAIYANIDAMNLDGFMGALSDDVELTFGNHPAAHGTAQARAAVGSFWASIGAIKHQIGTISREGDRATVEAKVEITRKDGRIVSVPSCSVIDRRGGKVTSMRTYVDLSPVSAA